MLNINLVDKCSLLVYISQFVRYPTIQSSNCQRDNKLVICDLIYSRKEVYHFLRIKMSSSITLRFSSLRNLLFFSINTLSIGKIQLITCWVSAFQGVIRDYSLLQWDLRAHSLSSSSLAQDVLFSNMRLPGYKFGCWERLIARNGNQDCCYARYSERLFMSNKLSINS